VLIMMQCISEREERMWSAKTERLIKDRFSQRHHGGWPTFGWSPGGVGAGEWLGAKLPMKACTWIGSCRLWMRERAGVLWAAPLMRTSAPILAILWDVGCAWMWREVPELGALGTWHDMPQPT
jgi:hypothetical protein